MVGIEEYDLRRFLPLPYEEALAPRLLRVQGRAEDMAGCLETRPEALQAVGARLRAGSGALVSVGDGGLAAKAVAQCLCNSGEFRLFFPEPSSSSLREILSKTEGVPVSVFASGPLRDPGAAAFLRILLERLSDRSPRGPACQVIAAAVEGTPLMNLARSQGWEIFPVPAQAGRFDALTAAGLLPAAAAGADVEALLQGAAGMLAQCQETSYENPAWRYAALRHELYRRGWSVEVLSSREPSMAGVLAWWQSLFAGCEGKDGKGLLPITAGASDSPCGFGQYLQEGRRLMFETALRFGKPPEAPAGWRSNHRKPRERKPSEGEKELDFLQAQAQEALLQAHSRAGIPCLRIGAACSQASAEGQAPVVKTLSAGGGSGALQGFGTARKMQDAACQQGLASQKEPLRYGDASYRGFQPEEIHMASNANSARALGELLCFFQFACALSAGLLDVDPQSSGALEAYHEAFSGLLQRLRGPEPRPDLGQL